MQASSIIAFGLLLLISTLSFALEDGYCTTSECKTELKHSAMIKAYQEALSHSKQSLQQSNCSVCNVEGQIPCLNNGTCIVTDDPYKYICDCPDNTTGDKCETVLSCEESNPCGANAVCTVFNHKKVCTCPPGYAGDPYTACDLRSKTACMSGDPHYTTFDGTTFDYQGTCPYYVMTACNSSDAFSIIGTNVFTDSRKIVSYISEFTLRTQGHEFRVDPSLSYFIDGIRGYYPNYWPSNVDPRIVATKPGDQVIIQDNISGAIITFYVGYLCAEVPLNPTFLGDDKMCGLWGNINDNCTDDIKDKNGNIFSHPTTCTVGTNLNAIYMMDTWVEDSTVNNCVEGGVVTNMTNTCTDVQTAQNQCDLIRQAMNGDGPFAACNALGHDIIDKYFHDCTYDVCLQYPYCTALDTFATMCQNQLPFVYIDNWRDIAGCPYTCPPHSTYSMRTPKCQNSCSDPHYSNSTLCHDGYEEGCTCDPGYFFDENGDDHGSFPYVCRPIQDCGCVDTSGNYYPPHYHSLNPTCSISTQCENGTLTSEPIECSSDGQCNNVNGFPTCQCDHGYEGDGYNCTDINECLDPSVCSANIGQGACTNLPGTYNCTCFSPYSGENCESYLPKRHCADLFVFNGIKTNGTYSVSIGADYNSHLSDEDLTWTEVFCDMESNGGGWTLMSHGNGSAGKTYNQYVAGFGDPTSLNAWLGLQNIYAMTQQQPTSLRVVIERCAIPSDGIEDETTECSYEYFTTGDASNQYAVFLNSTCKNGTEAGRQDGWITWNKSQFGPKFTTFDSDDTHNCSSHYYQTGWWFNYVSVGDPCGTANLNGLRYTCGEDEYQYIGRYLTYANYPVEDAYMYLRPKGYPNYDNHVANGAPTQQPGYETTPY